MTNAYEWIVSSQSSGYKLLDFLIQYLAPSYTKRFIKHLIDQQHCQVNGRVERFASTIVGSGDVIRLFIDTTSQKSPSCMEAARILYEDESLLIYNKPIGVACDQNGILSLLANYSQSLMLVHRLDRDTTGALILAKNESVVKFFIDQFKHFQVLKRYLAIVTGELTSDKGIVENYLGKKSQAGGQITWSVVPANNGLYAYTAWQCLARCKEASLVACFPKTGRTHQIRIHLAAIGHPIVGDVKYGYRSITPNHYLIPHYLLHAEEVSFIHPISNTTLTIAAPISQPFQDVQNLFFKQKN